MSIIARRSLFAVLAYAFAALSLAPAQAQDTPIEYAFDVSKIELCTDSTCSTAVLLGEGSQRFDLGSGQVAPGQAAGNFIGNINLAANQTFTHLRVTHGRAITMTATAAVVNSGNGNDCVTGGAAAPASSATQAAARVTTGAAASSQVFVVPNTDANNAPAGLAATYVTEGIVLVDATTLAITKALTTPFTTGDTAPSIDAAFDVAGAITFISVSATECLVILGAPSISITIR